jgi:hypothetical protein
MFLIIVRQDPEENPLSTPVEAFLQVSISCLELHQSLFLLGIVPLQVFIMSLGEFGDLWEAIDDTEYVLIGKIHGFIFIAILVPRSPPLDPPVPGGPPAQPADRHDGRHLRQDRRHQERVDAAVGKVIRHSFSLFSSFFRYFLSHYFFFSLGLFLLSRGPSLRPRD